ncbi:adenosylcobinamide-GDP ribazoletransferase [Alkaliphilus hydrothermalis]|uniref:Adenosylcobinamide-GDP ribazoletransferase n=1 Tax=Alkaliphilus hydrothermalis TaxID=1482730 RepID=A0ABS2NN88_9FIRM|nr:adenosylcobinamide-GDP ribazoletransferase [Alkaliphilus hydrothermalis]MBM7614414.1 adenosylcobinamide-GDP ribazoletransferase [Alkaliphilus hydrothermalis]
MYSFIGILQFLTRISVVKALPFNEEFEKGVVYFPLVGLVLGILLVAFNYILSFLLPPSIGVILTVTLYIFLTGGLHLDGLGDSFDGLYSNRPRERVLEIMKDSRLGTNALLAILMILLIKIVGLQSLGEHQLNIALILMPVMGRQALVLGSYHAVYARKEGMGNIFIGKVTTEQLMITLLITILISMISIKSLLFLTLLLGFAHWYKKHTTRIIGGMTGDTLGALCELTEAIYLLFLIIQIRI